MRKLLLSLLIICLLFLSAVYIFLPSKIIFSKVIVIKTRIEIANRFLMDESKWGRWFPSDSAHNLNDSAKHTYGYNKYLYAIDKKMMNVASVSISYNKMSLKSLVTTFSLNEDSVAIQWESEMPAGLNPFKRITNYIIAKDLQNNMADILKHLETFLAKTENLYGIDLHVIISKDSTLVATKCITKTYPSTADIYNLIAELKNYINKAGAKENNYPMLHVKKINETNFETMVAIPVNKHLEDNGKIFFSRFVPWKVLTAEVKGGNYTVNEALDQMKIYMTDYQIQAMAIPFASLVTDRSKQPDTSQWITRIYTPVP